MVTGQIAGVSFTHGSHDAITVHTPPTSQRDIRGFGHFARGGVNYYHDASWFVLLAYTV
jgi:hypothetical protein